MTIFWIIVYVIAMLSLVKLIEWHGKHQAKMARQELKYDIMYLNIQTIVDSWVVNEKNYHAIEGFFETMAALPHKNREKTNTLHGEFCEKYRSVIKEIRSREQ